MVDGKEGEEGERKRGKNTFGSMPRRTPRFMASETPIMVIPRMRLLQTLSKREGGGEEEKVKGK